LNLLAAASVTVAAATLLYAGRRLGRHLAPDLPAYAPGAVSLLMPVAVFVATVALAGRAARTFDAGLVAAAVVGLIAAAASRRWTERDGPTVDRSEHLRFDAALVLITVLYGYVAWRYQMHDEHSIFGHKSMVEQLRYGEYPIYLPPIPEQDARYHYGFDILAGALARAYGLTADWSIDVVTVGLAITISWIAAALVTELGARKAAPFAAVAIHLGAGLAWVMLAGVEGRHPRCLLQYHHPDCGVELFPTPFLNVFQHPVSIGVPLMFLFLIIARRLIEREDRWRWAALSIVILPALALGQLVYFVLGSLAVLSVLPLWALWFAKRSDGDSRAVLAPSLWLLATLAVGGALAWLGGGMFTPSPVTDPNLVTFRSGLGFPPNEPPLEVLRHHAVNLGVGFVLLPLFVWRALFARRFLLAALVSFAVGGILVPHGWTYVRSWDIVKFPSASAFVLTILVVAFVYAPMLDRGPVVAWVRRGVAALLIGSGVVAATFVVVPLQPKWLLYNTAHWKPDPLIASVIRWWRTNGYRREELIYVQSNVSSHLAVFGGLSVVGADYDFSALGIHSRVLNQQRRHQARIKVDMDPTSLDALGVRWVMLSVEELRNLGAVAQALLNGADGTRFTLMATFDASDPNKTRKIWRVESG